jgi:molybdenum-dependent DNA-binding transcriptional regulator ModE
MKAKKSVKRFFKKARPFVDMKFRKKKKGLVALKELLLRLKKREKELQAEISNLAAQKSDERKELEEELELLRLQRKKGVQLRKKIQKSLQD